MSRRWLLVLLGCAAVPLSATQMFVPGDLMWATFQTGKIFEISTGTGSQNFSGVQPAATLGAMQIGQMAFSLDAQTAYVSVFGTNSIMAVSNTGQISTFATGISTPTGLIRTSTGQLLVASYNNGNIYDITAGGNFAAASAYASGLGNPRNMVETAAGIYVADQLNAKVKLVAAGNVSEFAYNIDAVALVSFNGKLYATTNNSNLVYDITTGGNRTGKPQFASGRNFASLAVSNGKLYAGTNSSASQNPSAPIETGIWDISAGGSNWTIANSLAYGLPNTGDSLLTVVPNAQTVVTPPPVEPVTGIPEPGTGVVGLALVALGGLLRRRNWA